MMLNRLFQLVGLSVCGYILFQLMRMVYIRFLYSSHSKLKRILNSKKWVVVTGCTSGIGKGFAVESARRGANVVLVARSKDKLDAIAKELRDRFKVQTKVVVIDFSQKDIDYTELKNIVSSLDVSVLVNNVGINTEIPDRYLDTPFEEIKNMVHVNVDSIVEVTRAVGPSIVKMDGKGEGFIINLSSYTATSPVPHMAGYSGTKAFINAFSIALRSEYPNLEVLSINPMLVASQMTHIDEKRASIFVCTGERLAQDTFKVYGAPLLPATYSPYLPHALQSSVVQLLPEMLQSYVGRKQMISVKKKLLAKFERQRQRRETDKNE